MAFVKTNQPTTFFKARVVVVVVVRRPWNFRLTLLRRRRRRRRRLCRHRRGATTRPDSLDTPLDRRVLSLLLMLCSSSSNSSSRSNNNSSRSKKVKNLVWIFFLRKEEERPLPSPFRVQPPSSENKISFLRRIFFRCDFYFSPLLLSITLFSSLSSSLSLFLRTFSLSRSLCSHRIIFSLLFLLSSLPSVSRSIVHIRPFLLLQITLSLSSSSLSPLLYNLYFSLPLSPVISSTAAAAWAHIYRVAWVSLPKK